MTEADIIQEYEATVAALTARLNGYFPDIIPEVRDQLRDAESLRDRKLQILAENNAQDAKLAPRRYPPQIS